MHNRGFKISRHHRLEILEVLRPDGIDDWTRAPGAVDGSGVGLRGRKEEEASNDDLQSANAFLSHFVKQLARENVSRLKTCDQ